MTDILGHQFINIQLIADQFAANGYCEYSNVKEAHKPLTITVVVIPDLFEGDPVPLNKPGEFDMEKWRAGEYNPNGTAHSPPNVDPIVDSCLTEMREKLGCKVGQNPPQVEFLVTNIYRPSAPLDIASEQNT